VRTIIHQGSGWRRSFTDVLVAGGRTGFLRMACKVLGHFSNLAFGRRETAERTGNSVEPSSNTSIFYLTFAKASTHILAIAPSRNLFPRNGNLSDSNSRANSTHLVVHSGV
jgi:hypothetical protein